MKRSDSSYSLLGPGKSPSSPFFDIPTSPRSPSGTSSPLIYVSPSNTPSVKPQGLPRRWWILIFYLSILAVSALGLFHIFRSPIYSDIKYDDVKEWVIEKAGLAKEDGESIWVDHEQDGEKQKIMLHPAPEQLRGEGDTEPDERFLGFIPHSAYHNQRMELENAFLLGLLLNRTVLVPPVWLGSPSTRATYDKMASVFYQEDQLRNLTHLDKQSETWRRATNANLKSFGFDSSAPFDTTATSQPYPSLSSPTTTDETKLHRRSAHARLDRQGRAEASDSCREGDLSCSMTHPKDKMFLAWEVLVNLTAFTDENVVGNGSTVRMLSRWDLREKAIESLLGVTPEEILVLQDSVRDEFQFLLEVDENEPLFTTSAQPRFQRGISIPALRLRPERVLLVGSLFGKHRIFSPSLDDIKSTYGRAMAFRSPHILGPARAVAARLGGSGSYIGVHARVGDSVFFEKRFENMEKVWRETVGILVDDATLEQLWEKVKPKSTTVTKRSTIEEDELDSTWHLRGDYSSDEDSTTPLLVRRQVSERTPGLSLPPPTTLLCRSHLHADPALLPLNAPVYISTDAGSPLTHPALVPFFLAFPCTYILSDFDRPTKVNREVRVPQIGTTKRLVNSFDGQPLGSYFVPFLEAAIASLGAVTIGTPGSTMSEFASGELAEAYRQDKGRRSI